MVSKKSMIHAKKVWIKHSYSSVRDKMHGTDPVLDRDKTGTRPFLENNRDLDRDFYRYLYPYRDRDRECEFWFFRNKSDRYRDRDFDRAYSGTRTEIFV